jgi:ParB family chromosome partitioning protein
MTNKNNMAKKSPLGRGLGALIDNSKYEQKPVEEAVSTSAVAEIEMSKIEVNPFQPRNEFDQTALEELAASIKELGIIQPITVRKSGTDKFQIISGERRYRASKLAGLKSIIAFVRDADDTEMLEMALVENIQREDLNAIEIAISYERLIDECKLTQDKLSERVGKKRTTVTNYLRLLKLPAEIQSGLQGKLIGMGHARSLIGIEDASLQKTVYNRVIADELSVRELEKIIREINKPEKNQKEKTKGHKLPENFTKFKDEISKYFPGKISLKRNNAGRGTIAFSFTSDEEFDKIKELLTKVK